MLGRRVSGVQGSWDLPGPGRPSAVAGAGTLNSCLAFCTALIESLNQKPQPAGDQPQPTEATHVTHRKAAGANAPSANGEAGGGESTKGYTAEQVAAVKR